MTPHVERETLLLLLDELKGRPVSAQSGNQGISVFLESNLVEWR
jgi:hypothetical protein